MKSYQIKLYCPECWVKLGYLNNDGDAVTLECPMCKEIFKLELPENED